MRTPLVTVLLCVIVFMGPRALFVESEIAAHLPPIEAEPEPKEKS